MTNFFQPCPDQANEARAGKKSKITRDRDRDVSEQIALGQSNLAPSGGGDIAYDQRLFDQVIYSSDGPINDSQDSYVSINSQEQGLSSGFKGDDAYDLYDKPLFQEKVKPFV